MAFTPRTTAPSANDLRWIQTGSGGYNACIYGSNGAPSVLPNCTGYVHGRIMEIRGVNTDNCGLSFGDAVTYWNSSSSNWTQSQNPAEGAVLCYYTNTTYDQHPGHVAIVEQVIDNNTIVISESHYGGARWDLVTVYRSYGWRQSTGWNVTPQGFLLNPYITPDPPEPPEPEPGTAMKLLILYKGAKNRRSKHARIRRSTVLL